MAEVIAAPEWVQDCAKPGARVRVFCLPYAGGGASVFRAWNRDLPPEIEASPVQLPGRESRLTEPPFVRLPALIQALAAGVTPHLTMPFALFGHSMGALLAFELARELRARHAPTPERLFVSAHRAPHLPSLRLPIHDLPEGRFEQTIRELRGTPDAVWENLELRALVMPLLRADLELCETHSHQADSPLECPISAFGGREDVEVGRRELEAWRDHTRAEFSLRILPGSHFYLHSVRPTLLQYLAGDLAESGGFTIQRQP
jgi:medium-chain acyl-[acyl-carrier-protein] hydrolase